MIPLISLFFEQMLEVHVLPEDNQSNANPPAKFHLTQLKNGNYVLANFSEHYRLQYVLSIWQKIHDTVQNSDEKYKTLLEKSITGVNFENSAFLKDSPQQNVSNLKTDSFSLEMEKNYNVMSLGVEGGQQNFEHPEGNRVFIGCAGGYLHEYLLNERIISHDFGQVLDGHISSMATTFDNKYLFVCSSNGGFIEIDLATYYRVNYFGVENAKQCVVTYDNQFLITAPNGKNAKLTKKSIQTT